MNIKKLISGEDRSVLVSNFGYLSLLQVASYVFPLITLPYLARVIGAEGFGKIAFAAAVVVWFQTIADWGFSLTSTRDIAKNRDDKEIVSRILSATLIAKCILTIISFGLLLILILLISEFNRNASVLLATFLMIPGYIIFPDWFFQAVERMKYITIMNLIIKVLFTVLVFLFIKEKDDYVLQPILTSIGYIIAGLFSLYVIFKWNYRLTWVSFKEVWILIKNSTDVFINQFVPNIYNSFSTVVLGFVGGPVANGIYSEGNKFVTIAIQFLGIITRVFFPFLSRRIEKHNLFLKIYMGCSILTSIILFFIAPYVIRIFYTEEFEPSIVVMQIMAISIIPYCLSSAYGSNYLIIQGHEKVLRKVTLVSSIIGFLVAYPLILKFSYIGVALTILVARTCLGLGAWLAKIKLTNKN